MKIVVEKDGFGTAKLFIEAGYPGRPPILRAELESLNKENPFEDAVLNRAEALRRSHEKPGRKPILVICGQTD